MSKEEFKEEMLKTYDSIPLSAFQAFPEKEMLELSAGEYARIPGRLVEPDLLNACFYAMPVEIIPPAPPVTGAQEPPDPPEVPYNPAGYLAQVVFFWVEGEE